MQRLPCVFVGDCCIFKWNIEAHQWGIWLAAWLFCKFSIKAENYSVETLSSLIITKVWPGIMRNIHRTNRNQNRSNKTLKSRIARNPHRITHLVELRKQISYLLFIAFNFSWTMLLWCLWYSILRKWKYIVILSSYTGQ